MHAHRPSHPRLELVDFDDFDTTVEATPWSAPTSPMAQSAPELLDLEEGEPDTVRQPEPVLRPSCIRLRAVPTPNEVARFVERIHDEQLNLMVDIVCLEHAIA